MEGRRRVADGNSYSDGYSGELQKEEDKHILNACVHYSDDVSLQNLDIKESPQSKSPS